MDLLDPYADLDSVAGQRGDADQLGPVPRPLQRGDQSSILVRPALKAGVGPDAQPGLRVEFAQEREEPLQRRLQPSAAGALPGRSRSAKEWRTPEPRRVSGRPRSWSQALRRESRRRRWPGGVELADDLPREQAGEVGGGRGVADSRHRC